MSSPKATTPQPSDASAKPVWATGPEQITVELLFGGMYDIDVDIAKRMNIIHDERKSKDLVTVTACSVGDFEDALTFCANDRTCSQPPTETLARIMSEMDPTPVPAPVSTRRTPRSSLVPVAVAHDDSDPEDDSYVPSDGSEDEDEDSEDEDEAEEQEDEEDEDVSAELEALREDRKHHGEPSSPTTNEATKRLAGLQIADEEDEEDESYAPSSDSEASDSGDEYSDTDMGDIGTAAIKAERDEFKAKEGTTT